MSQCTNWASYYLAAFGISLFLLQGAPSQLIFYDRKDESGPKFSEYHITQITDSEGLQVRLFKYMYWFVVDYLIFTFSKQSFNESLDFCNRS